MTEQPIIIDYDAIVSEQLRAVIPLVLKKILAHNPAATETPPPHHFYISFNTRAVGVVMPSYLKNQYPDHMTIVLQHQFWNLSVGDDEFSVVLSFGKTPAAITIPYHAITQFSDPATNFTLRFDRRGDDAPADNKKQQATDVKNNNPTAQKPIAEQEDMPLTDNPTTDNNNGDSNVISLADFRKNQQTSS